MAAALALAACAGPAAKKPGPSPTASTAATAAPAAKPPPAPRTEGRPLAIAVFGPQEYRAGRKRRDEALAKRLGADALGPDNVGYYMEVQEADLQRRLASGTQLRISKQDQRVVIGPIGRAFASESSRIGGRLGKQLDAIIPVIREFSKTLVVIHAYTDASGPARYNLKLSMRRALAVAHYLRKAGVDGGRIVAVGHGESGPDAAHKTPEGHAENRRITIELDPLAERTSNHGGGY